MSGPGLPGLANEMTIAQSVLEEVVTQGSSGHGMDSLGIEATVWKIPFHCLDIFFLTIGLSC